MEPGKELDEEGGGPELTERSSEVDRVEQCAGKFDGQIQTEFLPAEAVSEETHRPGGTLAIGQRAGVLRALADTSEASESAQILSNSPLPEASVGGSKMDESHWRRANYNAVILDASDQGKYNNCELDQTFQHASQGVDTLQGCWTT